MTRDGVDQDCNGYDLTINIRRAVYRPDKDKLRVVAKSLLGPAATLQVEGYGPMVYNADKNKWKLVVKPAGGNPGTVVVSGPEGSETTTVTIK